MCFHRCMYVFITSLSESIQKYINHYARQLEHIYINEINNMLTTLKSV